MLYILGPGTTTRAIADELGLDKTLLGRGRGRSERTGRLVAADVNEAQLLELMRTARQGQDHRHAHRRAGLSLWPGQPADQPAG